MNEQEIINELLSKAATQSGHDLVYHAVTKNNGVQYQGIMINDLGSIKPVIYIDSIVKQIKDGTATIDQGADKICKQVELGLEGAKITPTWIVDGFSDFSNFRDRVYVSLVNRQENEKRLSNQPTVRFANLLMTYRIKVGNQGNEIASMPVTNDMLKNWGISKAELVKSAMENTPKLFPYTACTMQDKIQEMTGEKLDTIGDFPMVILSNDIGIDGAVCITDSEFLSKVSEQYFDGESFMILPSSVHEVIAIPKDMKSTEMLDMVGEVNRTAVDKKDFLATSVYEFNAAKKQVQCIATEAPIEHHKRTL